MMEMPDGSILLPKPPVNARKVAKGRRGHFTGQLSIGPDEGFGMDIESFTEFQVALTIHARAEVVSLENQVLFEYINAEGKAAKHYFDFRAGMRDGSRTAIMVKSSYRYGTPEIKEKLKWVASQVSADFADRVVVMTEKDIDPVEVYNAEMMHEMRWPDPVVDAAARRATRLIMGAVKVSDLVEEIGYGGQGFRAIVRLVRARELRLARHERISVHASVARCGADA